MSNFAHLPTFVVRCWTRYYSVHTSLRRAVRHVIHAHVGVQRRLAHRVSHAMMGIAAGAGLLTCVLVPGWVAYRALPPSFGGASPGPIRWAVPGSSGYEMGYVSPEIPPVIRCERNRRHYPEHERFCEHRVVDVVEPSSLALMLGPVTALAFLLRRRNGEAR
jgi:hypothetical protein